MGNVQDTKVDGPISRSLRLIRLLSEVEGDISVKDAARHLELPASTTHRLLNILQREGFVMKNEETQRYQVGLDLERIGSLLNSRKGLADLTRPYLQRIADQCGEACMFVGYLPATYQVSVMAAINSSYPLRYDMTHFEPHSVAWGATGRSIFAFLPEAEQRAIAEKAGVAPVSGAPLPPWAALKVELDQIREQGYAVTHGQKVNGAVGLGVPITDAADKVIGSFCITIPEVRYDESTQPQLIRLLRIQAAGFSNRTKGRSA